MKTWRASGHKHKKNKKTVAERKKIKRLQVKKDKLLSEYYHRQQEQNKYV